MYTVVRGYTNIHIRAIQRMIHTYCSSSLRSSINTFIYISSSSVEGVCNASLAAEHSMLAVLLRATSPVLALVAAGGAGGGGRGGGGGGIARTDTDTCHSFGNRVRALPLEERAHGPDYQREYATQSETARR